MPTVRPSVATLPPVRALNHATSLPRLQFIDAARGATMLFVLISHFAVSYFDDGDARGLWLQVVTQIASPTFMLVSGLMVGFLYRLRPGAFGRLQILLLDRGVFLLTAGHLLIIAASWPQVHRLRYTLITDAIGVSMIISPFVVRRLSPFARLALAGVLFTGTYVALVLWRPTGDFPHMVQASLFGTLGASHYGATFPLVPWCALDLIGTVIGERLAALYLRQDQRRMVWTLATLGGAAIVSALVLKGGSLALQAFVARSGPQLGADTLEVLRLLTSPGMKSPPSPAYFLFFGGQGLCWVALWLWAEYRGVFRGMMSYAAEVGRSSLFVFILQFFVYFMVLHLIAPHLPFRGAWPAYLLVTIVGILSAALVWHRRGYRRFLTVGIRRLAEQKREAQTDMGECSVSSAPAIAPRSAV